MAREEKVTFDGSFEGLNQLLRLHPTGVRFLCPICGQQLTVAVTWEEAARLGVSPGVYCPKDPDHVFRKFNIRKSQ